MLTSPVSQTQNGVPLSGGTKDATLGRDDFLRMLVAQLANQDPLNPQESTEFTAQLAQFSSLEQEISMRESLESINAALGRTDSVTAIGMIGQEVLADGEQFVLGSEGASLQFDLIDASDTTTLTVLDSRGGKVATIDAGALGRGLNRFEWDGRGSAGQALAAGVYSMVVDASAKGNAVDATPVVSGRVTGADVTGQTPILLLGDLLLPLSSVREVYAPRSAEAQP